MWVWRSEAEAQKLRRALEQRFADCGLQLHPQKTKVVYCQDANRTGDYPERSFDFLSYTFRPRSSISRKGEHFVSFLPAVGEEAANRTTQPGRRLPWHPVRARERDTVARSPPP